MWIVFVAASTLAAIALALLAVRSRHTNDNVSWGTWSIHPVTPAATAYAQKRGLTARGIARHARVLVETDRFGLYLTIRHEDHLVTSFDDGFTPTYVGKWPIDRGTESAGKRPHVADTLGFAWKNSTLGSNLGGDMTELAVPLWLVILVLLLPLLVAAWRWRRGRRRRDENLCPVCGYDLRATPTRCPECGKPVATPAAPAAASGRHDGDW